MRIHYVIKDKRDEWWEYFSVVFLVVNFSSIPCHCFLFLKPVPLGYSRVLSRIWHIMDFFGPKRFFSLSVYTFMPAIQLDKINWIYTFTQKKYNKSQTEMIIGTQHCLG